MARARQILFRIFYSTSFTIVFLLLVTIICIAPADALYESYRRHRLLDIFLITGAYVLTALIALLIYASRLYTNRSVLRDIPKTFLPIEKEDLPGKRVRRMIEEYLERSAVIAYQAKPRAKRIEEEVPEAEARILKLMKSSEETLEPKWGHIEHPGWGSPASLDLPGLEYTTVVDELTDLIEAKAVSLAPIDPRTTPSVEEMPMPDERIIELITRPEFMGMRQYLMLLIDLGVIPDTSLNADFLSAYEKARFGAQPLNDFEFQSLMRIFAELLRSMRPIDIDNLDSATDDESGDGEPDNFSSSKSTNSNEGSVRYKSVNHDLPPRRISEDSGPSMSEDELEVQLRNKASMNRHASRSSRRSKPTLVKRPSLRQTQSNTSVRTSRSSRSNGSVIRLTKSDEMQELPYTIQLPQKQV